MYKNQLGRRNLTDEQRTVLIGKMFEARKNLHGGDRKSKGQNGPLIKGDTAQAIADEIGVGRNTVKRAEKFTKGIDKLKEVSEEAADKILAGGSGVTKQAVMELPQIEPEQVKEFGFNRQQVSQFQRMADHEESKRESITIWANYKKS